LVPTIKKVINDEHTTFCHLKAKYCELSPEATVWKIRTVQKEGNRDVAESGRS